MKQNLYVNALWVDRDLPVSAYAAGAEGTISDKQLGQWAGE